MKPTHYTLPSIFTHPASTWYRATFTDRHGAQTFYWHATRHGAFMLAYKAAILSTTR